mmetsp:Transcript_39169/g.84473  ORF Transcript_39169/g.84473 Transcript_39169/m.84473 type:complete len:325 (-) Transcript_39169:907-1881(-)
MVAMAHHNQSNKKRPIVHRKDNQRPPSTKLRPPPHCNKRHHDGSRHLPYHKKQSRHRRQVRTRRQKLLDTLHHRIVHATDLPWNQPIQGWILGVRFAHRCDELDARGRAGVSCISNLQGDEADNENKHAEEIGGGAVHRVSEDDGDPHAVVAHLLYFFGNVYAAVQGHVRGGASGGAVLRDGVSFVVYAVSDYDHGSMGRSSIRNSTNPLLGLDSFHSIHHRDGIRGSELDHCRNLRCSARAGEWRRRPSRLRIRERIYIFRGHGSGRNLKQQCEPCSKESIACYTKENEGIATTDERIDFCAGSNGNNYRSAYESVREGECQE